MMEKTTVKSKSEMTRLKLLQATIEVISQRGYHNVTVDEIAKECGLSTGGAYRYFRNKKEMLIAALEHYFETINEKTNTEDQILSKFDSLEACLSYVLDQFYLLHIKYYSLHEELESLKHIDADIKKVYEGFMEKAIEEILNKCPPAYKKLPDLKERVYISIGILENYAHTQMKENSGDLDLNKLKSLSINAVISLLK